MIKSLKDARITDGLPRILVKQPWVRALSEAMGMVHEMTMTFADQSQIYTGIDYAAEDVLDALAVSWKIDWYDTGYSIEQKRRIIKTSLTVRRTMGTVAAVKAQTEAIYPGTTLEEWFQYDGEPGTFRLHVDVTTTSEEYPLEIASNEEIERRMVTAKRFSATMESMSYQVAHGIKVAASMDAWRASPPICGMIVCGIYPKIKALGWNGRYALSAAGMAEAYAVDLDLCGTLPEISTIGHSILEVVLSENDVVAYTNRPPVSGANHTEGCDAASELCGTLPERSTIGLAIEDAVELADALLTLAYVPPISGENSTGDTDAESEVCGVLPERTTVGYAVAEAMQMAKMFLALTNNPPISGTMPEIASLGHSVEGSTRSGENAVTSYSGTPPVSGEIRCGVKLQITPKERRK